MRDPHELLRHGAILSAAAIIAHPLSLGFHVVAGRLLPTIEYGALAAALGILALLDAPLTAVRLVVAHGAATNPDGGGRSIARRWFVRAVALGLGSAVVLVLAADSLSLWTDLGSPSIVRIMAVALVPIAVAPVVLGRIQGLQLFRWLAILGIIWAATRLGAGTLFMLLRPTAASGIAATALASSGLLVLGFLALRTPEPDRERIPPSTTTASLGLRPTTLAVIGLASLQNLDLVIVKILADADPAGLYAQASFLGRSLPYLTLPLATVLFPKAATLGVAAEGGRSLFVRAVLLSLCSGCVAVAVFVVAPQPVLGLIFGADRATPGLAALAVKIVPAFLPLAVTFPAAYAAMAGRHHRVHIVLIGGAIALASGVLAAGGDPRTTAVVIAVVQTIVMLATIGVILAHPSNGSADLLRS